MTLAPIPSFQKGIYQHYSGKHYEVIDVARHSETLEFMVIYRGLYGALDTWTRPFAMFFEDIEQDGQICPRFAFISNQTGDDFLVTMIV